MIFSLPDSKLHIVLDVKGSTCDLMPGKLFIIIIYLYYNTMIYRIAHNTFFSGIQFSNTHVTFPPLMFLVPYSDLPT